MMNWKRCVVTAMARHLWIGGLLGIGFLTAAAGAQVVFTGNYSENFDSMGSGTVYPSGWSGADQDGNALGLSVTSGTGTSGRVYNVGTADDADRALGTLATATTLPRFGVQFENGSAFSYTGLTLGGVMEQWRSGNDADYNESVLFEYSLTASSISDNAPGVTWFAVPEMNLDEKLTDSVSAGAVDGNLSENQRSLSATIDGIDWQPGAMLTFRWSDSNADGSDGMYAIDNFTMSAVPEPREYAAVAAFALLAFAVWRRRRADPRAAHP